MTNLFPTSFSARGPRTAASVLAGRGHIPVGRGPLGGNEVDVNAARLVLKSPNQSGGVSDKGAPPLSFGTGQESGEEWRPAVGWPAYEVSDAGRVRRAVGGQGARAGRVLVASFDHGGYPCIRLFAEGRALKAAVHRLVAEAFLGPSRSKASARPPKHDDFVPVSPEEKARLRAEGRAIWAKLCAKPAPSPTPEAS